MIVPRLPERPRAEDDTVPANRSRTARWRDCLTQVLERRGGLDLTEDTGGNGEITIRDAMELVPPDLIWRARLNAVSETELTTERPGTMGWRVDWSPGQRVIGGMSIGQNRWMFRTTLTAADAEQIRLEMPESVERCPRRAQHRMSTYALRLPPVMLWPLGDPQTALAAQLVCRRAAESNQPLPPTTAEAPPAGVDAGPCTPARLSNIGGGGIGIILDAQVAGRFQGSRLYFARVDLEPTLATPIDLVVRAAHTHLDSAQQMHAGLAFEFGLDSEHRAFVIDQIRRFMSAIGRQRAAA